MVLALQLRAHFKRHTGTKGIASNAERAVWLQLSDALHIVGCQGLDAVQRSGCGGRERTQMAPIRDNSTDQS